MNLLLKQWSLTPLVSVLQKKSCCVHTFSLLLSVNVCHCLFWILHWYVLVLASFWGCIHATTERSDIICLFPCSRRSILFFLHPVSNSAKTDGQLRLILVTKILQKILTFITDGCWGIERLVIWEAKWRVLGNGIFGSWVVAGWTQPMGEGGWVLVVLGNRTVLNSKCFPSPTENEKQYTPNFHPTHSLLQNLSSDC